MKVKFSKFYVIIGIKSSVLFAKCKPDTRDFRLPPRKEKQAR
jgi:hypothetical protein